MENPVRKVRHEPEGEVNRDHLKEQVAWTVDVVGRHRDAVNKYFGDGLIVVDALRYFNQEANEARDAWMRERLDHRRRRDDDDVSYEEELADTAIMGATALHLGQWPQVYSTDNVAIPTDIDDICTVAASSLDMWRWQGIFAHEDRERWWMDDVVRVIMGVAHTLGDDFQPEVRHKLIIFTYRWVDEDDLPAIWQDLDWLRRDLR